MDPAVLLQSKGDDAPSGENLEYDPAFTEMELAAQPGEESVVGNETIEATDPHGHTHGAAGLYGFTPQSRYTVYMDNLSVTPND